MLGVEHLEDETCVVTIDQRRMPILLVTWRGRASEQAVTAYFERLLLLCRGMGRQKFISVVDARAASIPTASVRKLVGERIADLRPMTEPVLLGSVVIVRTAVMRGVLTAIQWAVRGENRVVAVSDFQSAFEVASGVLRRSEITPPSDTSVPLYDLSSRGR